jgi:hypothetical protein
MRTKNVLFVSLASFLIMVSCSKKEDKLEIQQTALNSEEAFVDTKIDASTDDLAALADDQYAAQQVSTTKSTVVVVKSILPPCASVESVLKSGVWTRTIDFGTTGCTMPNGNELRGKIAIIFSADFTSKTRTVSVNPIQFYHNNNLVEGLKTFVQTFKSTDLLAASHPIVNVSLDSKITTPTGLVYVRTGNRVREMIDGFDTPLDYQDNVFSITGSGSLTMPNGNVINHTITTALLRKMDCSFPFPVKGIVEITKNNENATLDFGNETCDALAKIYLNGTTKEISLWQGNK